MKQFYIILSVLFLSAPYLSGFSLQGRLINKKGKPIADVYISLEGSTLYSISKKDGHFLIKNIPAGIYNIIFSHVAYQNFILKNIPVHQDLLLKKDIILQARLHLLETTLVTAFRQPRTAVHSADDFKSIDASSIRQRESKNPAEALREEGIAVQKTGHGGGSAILRGLSSNRILILVDGIRLNNALYRLGNHQYLTTVDANTLERMEVVHGPGSVLFGSDALGGTINLITFSADSFPETTKLHFKANGR